MDENLKKKIIEAQNGDEKALNEIVKENYGLIYSVAKRFENRGYDMEDIYQIGAMGMIKAIKKFDFSYDVMFSTFIVTYIIGEIRRFLRDDGPIKVSRSLKYLAAKIKDEKIKDENITIEELAKKLNEPKENIILAIDSSNSVESLEDKIDDDKQSILEKFKINDNQEMGIIDKLSLKQSLQKLNKRDKEIIYLRYYKCQTQKNVAKIIGISQVQVSRLEKKILKNLEEELKEA